MPKSPKWNEQKCPACQEPISVQATKCPHCQTVYSEEQIADFKTTQKLTSIGCGVLALAGFFALALCSSSGDDNAESSGVAEIAAQEIASEADLAAARQEAEGYVDEVTLPAGVPAPPVSAICTTELCETVRVQMSKSDWPNAWRGDYEAQRNVAFCYSDGCQGAFRTSKIDSCAWSSIVVALNVNEAQDGDIANLDLACSELSEAGRLTAARKAEEIELQIGKIAKGGT